MSLKQKLVDYIYSDLNELQRGAVLKAKHKTNPYDVGNFILRQKDPHVYNLRNNYALYRQEVFNPLLIDKNTYAFDLEVPAEYFKENYQIVEVYKDFASNGEFLVEDTYAVRLTPVQRSLQVFDGEDLFEIRLTDIKVIQESFSKQGKYLSDKLTGDKNPYLKAVLDKAINHVKKKIKG